MSRRLKGFAALVAAVVMGAATTATAAVSNLESYHLRHDFSTGARMVLLGSKCNADLIGTSSTDSAVVGPNGADSAMHLGNCYGPLKINGTEVADDYLNVNAWTLAMSFRPGNVEKGMLFSVGRLNGGKDSGRIAITVCSSSDPSQLHIQEFYRGSSGTVPVKGNSVTLTGLDNMTNGFHTFVMVYSTTDKTITPYVDGVKKTVLTLSSKTTTSRKIGNYFQYGSFPSITGTVTGFSTSYNNTDVAFYDLRFYLGAFSDADAKAYAALYPADRMGSPFRPSAYVESSATNTSANASVGNYIDTGYSAKGATTCFAADYQFLDVRGQQRIFGARGDFVQGLYINGTAASGGKLAWNFMGTAKWVSMNIDAGRLRQIATFDRVGKTIAVTNHTDRARFYYNASQSDFLKATGDANQRTYLFAENDPDVGGPASFGKARIYSFEADESGTPVLFLAPDMDNGEAGFRNIIDGTFHGDGNKNNNPERTLRFYNGVGCASDYKYENDTLYAKLYATSDEGGAVSVADGAAAASAEGWIPRGGTLALAATPPANMELKEWIGDTWAIADGFSATDASIEVATPYAVQLRATFKPAVNALLTVAADGATAVNWSAGDWRNAEDDSEQISAPSDKEVTIVAHKSFALTVDQTVSLSKLTVTGDVDCVVTLAAGSGSFLATEVVVKGGVLKLGSDNVLGKTPKVTVEDGGTIDVNGKTVGDGEATAGNVVTEFRIAGTGAGSYPWALTSSADMANSKNVGMLYLDADATIGGTKALWIGVRDGAGWDQANKNMNLGGHTLTKTGSGSLNIRRPYSGTGGGAIDLQEGRMEVTGWSNVSAAYAESCVSNITLVAREGTTAKNSLSYTLYFKSLDVRNATMTSNSGAFGVWETLSGHGSMAKLAMADGATAALDGNFTVSSAWTAGGALSLARASGVETNVTVKATGTLTAASGAINVGAGVIFDIGAKRPEETLSVDGNATLALRKASITNEVIVLNASSRPQNVVVYDVDGATVIADPVVAYDAGVLTISAPTPAWSNIDGTGSFESVENWSGNVPQPGESFIVNLSGDTAMTLGGSLTPAEILVAGSGTLAIFTGSHTFSESNVTAEPGAYCFVCAGTSENVAVWIGGASGNLGDATKWSTGEVPSIGVNAIITSSAEATLVNSAAFKAMSITFPSCSAAVAIDGDDAITGVAAITNLSSVSHTINVPVYFEGDIQVKQAAMAELGDVTKAHVTFAGGAYAAPGCAIENNDSAAVYSRCMFGEYHLASTENDPWSVPYQGAGNRICLGDNSALHVQYVSSPKELYIGTGSVVTAAVVSVTANASAEDYICWRNFGEFVITNEFTASGTGGKKNGYSGWSAGTSAANVFKIEKATCTRNDGWSFFFAEGNGGASHGTFYFGKGGLNFNGGNGCFGFGRDKSGDAQTIRPWYGDFAMGTSSGNADFDIYMYRDVTFNTDDENGIGRTITLNARLRFNHTPTFTVSGKGKVLVNSVANNSAQPTVTVTGTATLAYKPGANLTTGTTTVNSGATLQVAESGTVALGGNLTLADGAALGFNFTEKGNAPVLDLTGKTVAVSGTVNVRVSAEDGIRPKGGTYTVASGGKFKGRDVNLVNSPNWAKNVTVDENDNLVLEVKPVGSVFTVK